jgi:hypothetical protein
VKTFLIGAAMAFIVASLVHDIEAAPFSRSFEVNFTRYAHPDAPPTFDIRIQGLSFNDSAVGPSGRSYGGFFPTLPHDLSESQLYTELVGTWTINAFLGFNQPAEVHHFDLFPFSADDLFHAVPKILSPLANSTVPPNFVLSWEWPPGVTPPTGKGVGASGGATGATLDFGAFSGNSIPISVTFSGGLTQVTYDRFNAGSTQFFSNMTSVPTTTAANPVYKYTVSELYSNQASVPNVTVVVPEPGSLSIASILGMSVVALRGHRRDAMTT